MATSFRPSLLRQAVAAPATRAYSTPAVRSHFNAQTRPAPAWTAQRAAFQTSARRPILPPLPQVINGSVNDPVKVPEPHPSHGSYHWSMERLVSVALIPVTIAPFAAGALNPLLDGTLIGLTLIHTYIGFQSVIIDYIPNWRAKTWRKAFEWLNVLALVIVGWGYYEFETNDVGLTAGIARIWRAGANAQELEKQAEQKLS
ncbi:hypothetical protein DOTSEDRAFT_70689 [Dothistroma septosporum NZE10]|uniref:Succinate dehydrogenase [ubiquinone] cytochrome b small subunit n=1 Tax=Dothistroma septosporum (strain NZE10 / CBS 128990) TaxID=675120 RepID=N1PX51_DOTSN|nr:hypothetical protein DOTSEDRAFT_70689 [Dothistroma septosporum NZE10]